LGIPVFHDDQHGTAIVVLAGLINAAKLVGKSLFDLRVVINGAGAAGIAIARLLKCADTHSTSCIAVKDIILCDSKGIIHKDRENLNTAKREILQHSNAEDRKGTLRDALVGADVFIGVSKGDLLQAEDIRTMEKDAIVFGLANPIPEIMPEDAYKGGAAVVGTGRSDLPNQINNVLGFPGIFRGALDARAKRITPDMKLAAARAIADIIPVPAQASIIPSSLNIEVASVVSKAVYETAMQEMKV
ncbi:MAG: NAD-dependent malic enzyme, partial [Bacteroidota bacterium]